MRTVSHDVEQVLSDTCLPGQLHGVANYYYVGVSAYRPLSAFRTQEINGTIKISGRYPLLHVTIMLTLTLLTETLICFAQCAVRHRK